MLGCELVAEMLVASNRGRIALRPSARSLRATLLHKGYLRHAASRKHSLQRLPVLRRDSMTPQFAVSHTFEAGFDQQVDAFREILVAS